MNVSILTAFPELYERFLATSLIARAQQKSLIQVQLKSFFSVVAPKERIDAPTFGHGAGMLIKPLVVERALAQQEQMMGKSFRVFFSPHGKKLDQRLLEDIALRAKQVGHLTLVCARYEGMDARVEECYADEIISIGDFVLMGGDIPAMVFIEGLLRLIPGIVGKQESVALESFSGPFVDHPEYTEPVEWCNKTVPDVIRSGNHRQIQEWREREAAKRTVSKHFSWLRSEQMTLHQKKVAFAEVPHHYVVLMHVQVRVGSEGAPGTTSVTSIDLHDIARSSRTYGIERFFVVTPLEDQQKIVNKLLDFWLSDAGGAYNQSRQEAIKHVILAATFEEVVETIEKIEGQKPLVVATSARDESHDRLISFSDHEKVWSHKKPVLFVFGTGKGLNDELLAKADFLLLPVHGFSDFNHLSVRSAVAIVLDRWLGINERYAVKRLAV